MIDVETITHNTIQHHSLSHTLSHTLQKLQQDTFLQVRYSFDRGVFVPARRLPESKRVQNSSQEATA